MWGYLLHGAGGIPIIHELFKWIGYSENKKEMEALKQEIIHEIIEIQNCIHYSEESQNIKCPYCGSKSND